MKQWPDVFLRLVVTSATGKRATLALPEVLFEKVRPRLDRDNSVFDGVLNKFGAGLQLQEPHYSVFVSRDSARRDF